MTLSVKESPKSQVSKYRKIQEIEYKSPNNQNNNIQTIIFGPFLLSLSMGGGVLQT